MAFDGEKFGRDIVEAVNASIERQIAPLMRRLDALEAIDTRAPVSELERRLSDDVRRFDDALQRALTVDTVRSMIAEAVEADDTVQMIDVIADKAVARYVKDIPVPKDGKDVDMDAVRSMIVDECKDIRAGLESTIGPEMQEALSVMVKEAVATIDIPVPKDGKDADPVDVDALADRVRSMIVLPELPEIVIPELPDIAGMVKELSDAAEVRASVQIKSVFDEWRATEFHSHLNEAVKAIEIPPAPELPDIAVMVAEAVKAIPPARDGKDAEPVDIAAIASDVLSRIVVPELPDVKAMVAEAVATIDIPVPKDGKDADPVDMDAVKAMVAEAVATIDIPVPKDGKDADPIDMDAVNKRVDETLTAGLDRYKAAVAEIPIPKDGTSVTVDDVKPLIDEAVSKAVAALPPARDGKDGVNLAGAVIDRSGDLQLTLSNGEVKNVGRVVGDDGVDCDIDGVWKILNQKIADLPKPQDGLGFDDMSFEYDGERSFKFIFERGDKRKEFPFTMPVVLDRGVYSEGKSYTKGDAVTWDGSSWIAQSDEATEKPGTGKQWRLAIKRGTRGKDGVLTVPKAPAPVMLGGR